MKVLSRCLAVSLLVAISCLSPGAHAFSAPSTTRGVTVPSSLNMAAGASVDTGNEGHTSTGLLKRDRYVATNRFSVRKGKGAKFEKRWATRKSKLATLDGFKYFHLMRRVTLNEDGTSSYDEGDSKETSKGNYVSFTIWEQKKHFGAWRKGEAFKEAHGGTSIGAFLSTMLSSARVLRGAPKPAFYDGTLTQASAPEELPDLVDGWRSVEADGTSMLPAECFVACNQFFVPSENAAAFENRWADRESKLNECDGFVAFSMLRRDGNAKGHGTGPLTSDEPTYTSTTIWKDRKAFDGWKAGSAFKKAHSGAVPLSDEKAEPPKPKPLWGKPPSAMFYEGTLVISKADGA